MGVDLLAFPPTRLLASIAAALLVSGVLSEGLIALLPWIAHDFERLGPTMTSPPPVAIALQLLIWAVAAFVSAALATALTELRSAGWVAGSLWLVPALITCGLVGMDSLLLVVAGILILATCLAGTNMAHRFRAADAEAVQLG